MKPARVLPLLYAEIGNSRWTLPHVRANLLFGRFWPSRQVCIASFANGLFCLRISLSVHAQGCLRLVTVAALEILTK